MRKETTIFVFLFMILGSSFTPKFALAEDGVVETILISTDKLSYFIGEPIMISGEITNKKMPVMAIRIFDPDDKILGAHSVELDETNHFTKTIIADIPFYEKPGIYTITAEYGKLKSETFFEIESESAEITDVISTIEELPTMLPQIVSFETNKKRYQNEDTIVISGKVSAISEPQVTIAIFDPYKMPAGIYLVNVNPDLTFSISFLAKYDVNFKVEGTYLLTAQYGGSETKQNVEIEFVEEINTSVSPTIESEVSEYTDSVISNTPDTSQTKNISEIEEYEIKKSSKFNYEHTENKNVTDNIAYEPDKETVYFYSSVNCEKNVYEDIIVYYNNPGPALARLCKYQDAIFNYDQTLQSDPENVHALTNKGAALSSLGRYQEAISYYDKALEIDPQYVTALNNKGNTLSSLGRYQEAISYYDKALEIDPQYITALNNKEKTSTFLMTYSSYETEPKTILISEQESQSHTENRSIEKTDKHDDIATQFANVFSSIGASLISLFGG